MERERFKELQQEFQGIAERLKNTSDIAERNAMLDQVRRVLEQMQQLIARFQAAIKLPQDTTLKRR